MNDVIQAVIMSRGEPACPELQRWLAWQDLAWRYGSTEYGIDVARNQNVNRFLREDEPRGKTSLLMIDADMVPFAETQPILEVEHPLTYCGYLDRGGSRGHFGEHDFGAACFRASAKLLASMGPPWFLMRHNEEHTRRIACECDWFRRRAVATGALPRMVGIIGHRQTCILYPDEAGKTRQIWPHLLKEGNHVRRTDEPARPPQTPPETTQQGPGGHDSEPDSIVRHSIMQGLPTTAGSP